MDLFTLLQVGFNLVLSLGIIVLWLKLKRPPQDDPRLSRGLQLLQSKIAVLEDLSDRTDTQVKQLILLLEQQGRRVHAKVEEAQKQIQIIDQSMHRSREVAQIFQDKIPHQEIIERQKSVKYIKAALLAHEGKTVAEIAQTVQLPVGEIEFITKVNKDQLMFDSSSLPDWAKDSISPSQDQGDQHDVLKETDDDFFFRERDFSHALDLGKNDYTSLKKLGDEFRQACRDYEKHQEEESPSVKEKEMPMAIPQSAKSTNMDASVIITNDLIASTHSPLSLSVNNNELQKKEGFPTFSIHPESLKNKEEKVIRKVEFPRIDR